MKTLAGILALCIPLIVHAAENTPADPQPHITPVQHHARLKAAVLVSQFSTNTPPLNLLYRIDAPDGAFALPVSLEDSAEVEALCTIAELPWDLVDTTTNAPPQPNPLSVDRTPAVDRAAPPTR